MVLAGGFTRARWARLALAGLALAVALARPAEAQWWLVRISGGGAALAMAWAALVTPRSADRTSRTWRHHQRTGRIGLGLALVHAGLVAAGETAIWRYAGRLASAELVAGAAALVLLIVLSLARDPLSPWMRSGPAARALHRWAAVAVIVLSSAHVAANPAMPRVAFVLLAVAAAVLVRPHAGALIGLLRQAPRGLLAAGLASGLVVGIAGWGLAERSQRALRASPIDHAGFDHKDHDDFTCVACHHNFLDRSGTENCLNCHKRLSVSSATRIDRVFHKFCTDCHEREWWRHLTPSPFKSCAGCHGVALKRP